MLKKTYILTKTKTIINMKNCYDDATSII